MTEHVRIEVEVRTKTIDDKLASESNVKIDSSVDDKGILLRSSQVASALVYGIEKYHLRKIVERRIGYDGGA
jgi:hypothetical protein